LSLEGNESEAERAMSETEKEKKGEKARIVVSVREISCTVCAQAIEKQVKKINGIEDVKTAVMLNKVFIDYDSKLVDTSTIRKAIDKTGFKSYMTVRENHSSSTIQKT
jgi:copper chaperone CopZ